MAVPTITVTPDQAARAYRSVEQGGSESANAAGGASAGQDFGSMLTRALGGVVESGHAADAQAMQALSGGGDVTSVVTAVARADLALQTTTAIRDKVVQAYQDIMRMPI